MKTSRTNNLTNTRHEQITAFSAYRASGTIRLHLLHVERLQLRWESIQEDRSCKDISHPTLSCLRNVVTHDVVDHFGVTLLVLDDIALGILSFVLDTMLVEPFDGIDIR